MFKKINSLFEVSSKPQAAIPPQLSENERIYCIGDIHGRYDLLKKLHELIVFDAKNAYENLTLIYLGDYIDRGTDSKSVIEHLLKKPLPYFKQIFLLGNHEQVLLEFLHKIDVMGAAKWFSFGGLSTLMSYGVDIKGIPTPQQIPNIRQEFKEKIPKPHIEFFKSLKPYYQQDDYYFTHAGINPDIQLKHQHIEDLLWIRDDFLKSTLFHGKMIVHGHSVSEAPVVLHNRIGIDTGAYQSNILSCVVLEGTSIRFLST